MTKRIDVSQIPALVGSQYPPPFDEPCRSRERQRLGDAAGLAQFGVNMLRLPPGAWSSQRHWHATSDEFIYVVAGQVVLVTDAGEEVLAAGDAAGFKSGDGDGHCLQNRSDAEARILEVGTRPVEDTAQYPDIDLVAHVKGADAVFTNRQGTPYPANERRGPEEE